MAEQEHANLRRVFDLVIAAAPADRGPLLDRECRGDAGLRQRIEGMVAAAEDERFLGSPTADGPGVLGVGETLETAAAPMGERPGMRIGPYKILQLIGEGGFGSVFMAEQEKPVARRVALKIIKLGMDTRQVVARFEQERQALAMMDHPHIARVLDAGATEAGRPYFVMDLVKGDPIAEYCDKNNLNVNDRLELFAQVCNAVQHAHQKGIIHRDIKPSNILVTTQDGKPHAKVIDFGIAKATASKLTEKTLFTEHKALIGTPEYMSPEQAEGSLDIDTRTDVYSLGVLLYELLTGSTPFSGKDLRSAAYAEIQRIIREVEPPKPSTRISQNSETIASVASRRQTEPKRLGSMVRGELDWIVMRALEKDRQRRYETANGLAMDVRRYLDGEAVLAAPPSTAYRFKKFIKRNKGPVAAGLIVAAALVVGVIGTSAGMMWALDERDRANEAATSEARARTRAEKISTFVITALQSGDALSRGGAQDTTILAAMDNALKDIDSGRFKDDPETEADLKSTIAVILENNGRMQDAEPLAVRVLEILRQLHPGDHEDTALALNSLAKIQDALGRSSEAEPTYVQAGEMQERLFPGDHIELATTLNNLAYVRHRQGQLNDAEPLYVRALEMRRRLKQRDEVYAVMLSNLAVIRQHMGQVADEEQLLTESLEVLRRLFTGDHPSIGLVLNNLGMTKRRRGLHEESERLLVQSLEMNQRLYKGDHPQISMTLLNVGAARRIMGRLDAAEPLLVEALAMDQRLYPGDHPDVAMDLSQLAVLWSDQGRASEAEPLHLQSLEMFRRLFAGDHHYVAKELMLVAETQQKLGRNAEAERHFLQSLQVWRRLFKSDRDEIARNLSDLAWTHQALGKTAEARQEFDEAVAMLRRLSPDGSASLARVLWRSGSARLDNKDAATALAELEESVPMAERFLPAESPSLKEYRATLAECRAAIASHRPQVDP